MGTQVLGATSLLMKQGSYMCLPSVPWHRLSVYEPVPAGQVQLQECAVTLTPPVRADCTVHSPEQPPPHPTPTPTPPYLPGLPHISGQAKTCCMLASRHSCLLALSPGLRAGKTSSQQPSIALVCRSQDNG